MSGRTCDIAIIGGGLSGGLIALALARRRPDLVVRLIEAGPVLGGNHRWSWFGSDLDERGNALLSTIRKVEWNGGNDVAFPDHRRTLATPYHSIASEDFAAALERELAQGTIMVRREVVSMDAGAVDLRDGSQITARSIIDARGFAPTGHLTGGWQVFMGRHLRTATAHGIARPIIMDARVEQLGGYRFVYVLPLGLHDLFIEDTYYQDTPHLDRSALSSRLDEYCNKHGWDGEILGFETGVLPVITGGDFGKFQAGHQLPGITLAGARGGFVHPLTSYTLPFAVDVALAIADDADLPGDQLAAKIAARARRHWKKTGFYRLLGSMLFGAARPEQRYRIFQRFYGLPEGLIERFYTARSSLADRARVLIGRPPVPLMRAMAALFSARPALQQDSNSPTPRPQHPERDVQ